MQSFVIGVLIVPECEGACVDHGGHRGPVRECRVSNKTHSWGKFNYCTTAQLLDAAKGLRVDVIPTLQEIFEKHRSSDETLIAALRELAATVTSDDGVAAQAIGEAADRLAALSEAIGEIRDAVLNERHQMAEAGFDCDQVNAVLGIIDDHDPRVI